MNLIVLDSSESSRKLWKLLSSKKIDSYRVISLKYFRDFPQQTPKGTKKEDLGIDLENDFEVLWDVDQISIKTLMKEIHGMDAVYLGFVGNTAEYKSFLIRTFIKERFPFKNIYRVKFTAFTIDRVLQDLANAKEDDFNEILFERELALRTVDRLSRYYINNKLRHYKVSFPGISSYYVLHHILQMSRGVNVVFGKDTSIKKHFKTNKKASSFLAAYDESKITKETEPNQYEFQFFHNHFFRSPYLLEQYSIDILEEGLWFLFKNGYITDPTRMLTLTDSEYAKCVNKLELFSNYFNNRSRNKEGVYVTDINIDPDKVYYKFQNIYRLIWRSTLAAFSKSCKGTKHTCFYDKEDLGSYSDISYDGFTKFLREMDRSYSTGYHSFSKGSIEKPVVTVENIIAHFGYRGSYCLKELSKASYIRIKEGVIYVEDTSLIMTKVLDKVYPNLFDFSSYSSDSFVLRELLDVKTASDRISFLTKFSLKLLVPPVNLDLPPCPECHIPLRLSIGSKPMLICKTPSSGGCGSVFPVTYKKGNFVIQE